MIGPARESVGLGPGGLVRDGQPEIPEEGEVEGMRPYLRQRGLVTAIGHHRGADAAVGEVVLGGERIPLAIDPRVRIGNVLKRRGAAMDGHHVRPAPPPGRLVGISTKALRQ